MSNSEKPYYLVKFIDKKWADKLIDGEVFMRAIACFGDISRRSADSQNEFRGDVLEGINYYCIALIIVNKISTSLNVLFHA